MRQWIPTLPATGKPRYIEIADAIRADVGAGNLQPGDRLPPQRNLAQKLGLDYTTVSRGYAESARRGDIESFVGRGSFVCTPQNIQEEPDPRRTREEDPMMNMPPETDDPDLILRMEQGLSHVSANLVSLLRYQSAIGSAPDREMAARWMQSNGLDVSLDRLAITPGAHSAVHAILSNLREPGLSVLCENITYPGIRAIAAQLRLRLIGLEMDEHGIVPHALEKAARENKQSVLYLNPTLQNPMTHTMPAERRQQIATILREYEMPLIEDDAGCFVAVDAPGPISNLVPHLGWHIAGLSKCLGAGLRLALTTTPEGQSKGGFMQIMRTINIMSSPISAALMSRWIEDGTARALQRSVRKVAATRQKLAAKILNECDIRSHDHAFNIWLNLPDGTSRAEVMGRMTNRQIGIMPSDAFTVSGPPSEAVRVCLGGPVSFEQLTDDLHALKDATLRKDWIG